MKEKMIQEIYDNVSELLLAGIFEENKNEIKKLYFDYLKKTYNKENVNDLNYKEKVKHNIEYEKQIWSTKEYCFKCSELLEDSNLIELQKLSIDAYKSALKKKNENIVDKKNNEEIQKIILNMKKYSSKCLEYNLYKSTVLLSEGILDLMYACNISEITSSRLDRTPKN